MSCTDQTPGSWRLCVLGAPALMFEGSDPRTVQLSPASALVLAVLAIDGPRSRQYVGGLLWPYSVDGGHNNLRQLLHRLRGRTGHELIVGAKMMELDVRLRTDIREAQVAIVDDPDLPLPEVLADVTIAYSDLAVEWLANARLRCRRDFVAILQARAAALLDAGQTELALRHARRATSLDSADEQSCVLAMRALYLLGRTAEGIEAFRSYDEAVRSIRSASPGAAVRDMLRLLEQAGSERGGSAITGSLSAHAERFAEAPRLALAMPPRIVGRDRERAQLARAVEYGLCILVSGPPGIGKTRLLADLRHVDAPILCVGARPSDEIEPYATAMRLLRAGFDRWGADALAPDDRAELARLMPEFGMAATDTVHTARLQRALNHALRVWHVAGLRGIALDDLHYADAPSVQWLLRWADSAERRGVACVLATRDHEIPDVARDWLQRWAAAGTGLDDRPEEIAAGASRPVCLHLDPLERSAVAELLRSLEPTLPWLARLSTEDGVHRLYRLAGGTPLYLLHAISQVGRSDRRDANAAEQLLDVDPVRSFLRIQLSTLAPAATRLLQVSSLVDERIDADVVAMVLQVNLLDLREPWQELESRGLLINGAVSHDLLAQAVRTSLPDGIRTALHRSLAQAYESFGRSPAAAAPHWRAAGEWRSAALSYESAAKVARERHAKSEELSAAEAAMSCWRAAGPAHGTFWFSMAAEVGLLRIECARPDLAIELAQQLFTAAHDDHGRAVAGRLLATGLFEQGLYCQAVDTGSNALPCAERVGDAHLLAWLTLITARALTRLDRSADARALLGQHPADTTSMPSQERLRWSIQQAELLGDLNRKADAIALLDQVIVQARRVGDWFTAGEAGCSKSTEIHYLGLSSSECLRVQEQSFADYARLGLGADDDSLLLDQVNLVGFLRDVGRLREFLVLAERMPVRLRAAGYQYWLGNHGNVLATGYCWLGRHDLAARTLAEPLPEGSAESARAARLLVQARLKGIYGVVIDPTGTWIELTLEAVGRLRDCGATSSPYVQLKADLEEARAHLASGRDVDLDALERRMLDLQGFGVLAELNMLRLQHLLASDARHATTLGYRLFAQCAHDTPPNIYAPEAWWTLHLALAEVDAPMAADALHRAAAWIIRVADDLDAEWRPAFLSTNLVNRLVLAAWNRAQCPSVPPV